MENTMPILNVKVSALQTPQLVSQVSGLLLDLSTDVLKKKRELVSIAIDFVDPAAWTIGGVPLSQLGQTSIFVDIKVTDETNTKQEKEQFIRLAFDGLASILGNLHEHSYVHVHDVRAAAYGYGGHTQEFRYHHA
jgi:4-oxalocrotonate tautomerase